MDTCSICGMQFSVRSYGGPGICPACDCGFTGASMVKAQREEIERLQAEVRDLYRQLGEPRCQCIDGHDR